MGIAPSSKTAENRAEDMRQTIPVPISQVNNGPNVTASMEEEKKVRKHYSIVLLGKSGSGKSTLINMIANAMSKTKYKDQRTIAITQRIRVGQEEVNLQCSIPRFKSRQSDAVDLGQHCSQTQHCQYYDFRTEEFDLTLVDTPGLKDTRGVEQDIANMESIANAIGSMGEIHGIVIVFSAHDNRLEASNRYCLEGIKCLFTKHMMERNNNLMDNVILIATHTESDIKCVEMLRVMGIYPKKVFTFDNDCIIPHDVMDRNSGDSEASQHAQRMWKKNINTVYKLMQYLDEIKPVQTTHVKDIAIYRAVLIQLGKGILDNTEDINKFEILAAKQQEIADGLKRRGENTDNANADIARTNKAVQKVKSLKTSLERIVSHLYRKLSALSVSPLNLETADYQKMCEGDSINRPARRLIQSIALIKEYTTDDKDLTQQERDYISRLEKSTQAVQTESYPDYSSLLSQYRQEMVNAHPN